MELFTERLDNLAAAVKDARINPYRLGEYLDPHGNCHLCDVTCLECTGPEREDCTRCPTSWFFNDGKCGVRCQRGRFPTGNQCSFCHHTCQDCTDEGPDNCTSCGIDKFGVDRYLFQGQCRDACPGGFFHSKGKVCEPCPPECLGCVAQDRCLNCTPGHKLKDNQCVRMTCNKGEVAGAEDVDCLHCDDGCERCDLKDPQDDSKGTVCLTCEDGFYRLDADCHRSCPDRTYNVNETMTCAPCNDAKCLTCDQPQCYWCEEGSYLLDGDCVEDCGEGFFVDRESGDCEPCDAACLTCGGPRHDDCDSCGDGATLRGGECLEGRSLVVCPEKQFANARGECEECHTSCKTCFASSKESCSSCDPGFFLTAQQTCTARCPSATFANETSGRCAECPQGCAACPSAQECQRCRSGLYLDHGACVPECQRGFPEGGACKPCSQECASCRDDPSRCLSCKPPYLLQERSCTSRCLGAYYPADGECRRCPSQCKACTQDGLCTDCEQFYFLHAGQCVEDCPSGYFGSQQQECVRCHSDCASCAGPGADDCDACLNPRAVLYNGECLSQCPQNTFHDETANRCRDCDRSCLTCSGHGRSSCLSCDANTRRYASGSCVWRNQCDLTSYMDQSGQCHPCHQTCRRCSGPGPNQCLSCDKPWFLLNSTCAPGCPSGYFGEDSEERACERCHPSCRTCTGRHSLQCVACTAGFFKQGSSCVEQCSDSHFGNNSTMVCDRCDPSCNRCWGPGNRNCLSCRQDFVLVKRWAQCLRGCPATFYLDDKSKICHKCHPTCKTCSDEGALFCQSCYEGFTHSRGICTSPCLVGFYPVPQGPEPQAPEPTCIACHPSCINCRGPGAWNCTVCPALQMLSDDGRCLTCCGEETHHGGGAIPRECCDCSASSSGQAGDECIMGVNFVFDPTEDLEAQGGATKRFAAVCVLLILSAGLGVFIFLSVRARSLTAAPKPKAGGYVKVDSNSQTASRPDTSSSGDYNDRVVECEDEDEEEEDVDIVYMSNDGTVYRKFKYGLLTDEEEIELDYDDESYSYK